jgi:NAD(P)-dependent dehydrogenase (short-subunit alcohol dehydrogenase family)
MTAPLTDTVALITGSSSGIGAATARRQRDPRPRQRANLVDRTNPPGPVRRMQGVRRIPAPGSP